MLPWIFTLIHKLGISEGIHCRITDQWNEPMRQNHLRHQNLCSGVGTKRAGHVKFAAALPRTSTIGLSCVLKILNLGAQSTEMSCFCVLCGILAVGCWEELWGRERSEFGGDKFCGDSFRSDKCCGLTLTATQTSLSAPSSLWIQTRPATKEKIHYLSQIWDTHPKSQGILSQEGAMAIKRGIYSLLTSAIPIIPEKSCCVLERFCSGMLDAPSLLKRLKAEHVICAFSKEMANYVTRIYLKIRYFRYFHSNPL